MLFQWLQRSYSLAGSPKHDFSWNLWNTIKSTWNVMQFHEFYDIYQNFGLASSPECQAAQPLLFLRKIKVSWRVADGWKHKISWFSLEIMKFQEVSWIFINPNDFHAFRKISAPQRWYAKTTVIPMLFQWLQCSYSCPGTPKSHFLSKYWFQTKCLGIFMKFADI